MVVCRVGRNALSAFHFEMVARFGQSFASMPAVDATACATSTLCSRWKRWRMLTNDGAYRTHVAATV